MKGGARRCARAKIFRPLKVLAENRTKTLKVWLRQNRGKTLKVPALRKPYPHPKAACATSALSLSSLSRARLHAAIVRDHLTARDAEEDG